MDCKEFDEQVVRLEEIEEMADEFVRVRLARIEDVDLRLFEFDLDLTFMVFFLNADEQIYGRFGGRDPGDADRRQSLVGLRFAMEAALDAHRSGSVSPALQERGRWKDLRKLRANTVGAGCVHCHEAKEILYADLKATGQWSQDLAWRYPLPDNLGLVLEVDRPNVVGRVDPGSPAADLGIQLGDVVEELGGLPVHSFGDAQFALDRAPKTGSLPIVWKRGEKRLAGKVSLPEGWRKTDISWRPSLGGMIATAPVYGEDLTAAERKKYRLEPDQLAFWQQSRVGRVAGRAGIRAGDLVVGFDGKTLEMDAYRFQNYVRSNYISGDDVTVDVIRKGKRLSLSMTLE